MRSSLALVVAAILLPFRAAATCNPPDPQATLVPQDPTRGSRFGAGVAIAGARVAVGFPLLDVGGGNTGAVDVFAPDGAGGWSLEATLAPPAGDQAGWLGTSVAAEGDTIAAGAIDWTAAGSGSAHVFTWDGLAWTHQSLRPTLLAGASVGRSIAISGDRLVVGAPYWGGRHPLGGTAWIYVRTGGAWSLEAELVPSDARVGQFFGHGVDIHGDRAVVGAPQAAGSSGDGAAFVFERLGGAWVETARLEPMVPVLEDEFGSAVALDGDTLIVTSPRRALPGTCGTAFHFEWDGAAWIESGQLTGAPTEGCPGFGQAAALAGDVLAVADFRYEPARKPGLHVFVRRGGTFRALAAFQTSDVSTQLPSSCAIAEDIAVLGGPGTYVEGAFPCGAVVVERACIESDCADSVDDDEDGAADCADPDCRSPACPEICDDDRDDDGDELADCADPDCFSPSCDELCGDGLDNDVDGAVDCADPECNVTSCPESCADGRDNDADGLTDCADPACFGAGCAEICDDGGDNDRDGRVDCRDADCAGLAGPGGMTCESAESLCSDGGDNDGDGRTDCADPDCAGRSGPGGAPCESREASCGDGSDNDGDALTDCADPDCSGMGACPCMADSAPPGVEVWPAGTRITACASFPPPTWNHAWDWDPAVDSNRDGDACNDVSATGCSVLPSWSLVPGLHGYCATFTWPGGSTWWSESVFVVPAPPPPVPTSTPVACEGDVTQLSCGATDRCARYSWDLDVLDDSSGNGDPDDDVDATGCDAALIARGGSVTAGVTAHVAHAAAGTSGITRFVTVMAAALPATPVPTVTLSCAGEDSVLDCGSAAPGVAIAWDLDASTDSDGDGETRNDDDALGCVVAAALDRGLRTVTATATSAAGCQSSASLAVDVPGPPTPAPSALVGCPSDPVALRCGSGEATIAWDLDVAVDSDGNGTPDDDDDASGCDVTASFPEGVTTAQVRVTDASGCSAVATLPIVVGPAVVPGGVRGVTVERSASTLTIRWTGADAASRFRVTRGSLVGLAASGTLEHAADDVAGRGACDAGSGREWTDPNDAADGGSSFYLVLALNDCSLAEGPAGSGSASGPVPRPARTPTASCP